MNCRSRFVAISICGPVESPALCRRQSLSRFSGTLASKMFASKNASIAFKERRRNALPSSTASSASMSTLASHADAGGNRMSSRRDDTAESDSDLRVASPIDAGVLEAQGCEKAQRDVRRLPGRRRREGRHVNQRARVGILQHPEGSVGPFFDIADAMTDAPPLGLSGAAMPVKDDAAE